MLGPKKKRHFPDWPSQNWNSKDPASKLEASILSTFGEKLNTNRWPWPKIKWSDDLIRFLSIKAKGHGSQAVPSMYWARSHHISGLEIRTLNSGIVSLHSSVVSCSNIALDFRFPRSIIYSSSSSSSFSSSSSRPRRIYQLIKC